MAAAFIRPAPGTPRRRYWNMLHLNLGRTTVLLAWACSYVGMFLYYTATLQNPAPWIAAFTACLACVVAAVAVLEWRAGVRARAARKEAEVAAEKATTTTGPDSPSAVAVVTDTSEIELMSRLDRTPSDQTPVDGSKR